MHCIARAKTAKPEKVAAAAKRFMVLLQSGRAIQKILWATGGDLYHEKKKSTLQSRKTRDHGARLGGQQSKADSKTCLRQISKRPIEALISSQVKAVAIGPSEW